MPHTQVMTHTRKIPPSKGGDAAVDAAKAADFANVGDVIAVAAAGAAAGDAALARSLAATLAARHSE
eukprot:4979085-Pleurochrysis_carterae.AAC.2